MIVVDEKTLLAQLLPWLAKLSDTGSKARWTQKIQQLIALCAVDVGEWWVQVEMRGEPSVGEAYDLVIIYGPERPIILGDPEDYLEIAKHIVACVNACAKGGE